MIKESSHQDDIRILTAYTPDNRVSKYMKQKTERTARRNREIQRKTVTMGGFNCPISITDKTSRPKISKNIKNLNNKINQLDQADNIGKTLYSQTT